MSSIVRRHIMQCKSAERVFLIMMVKVVTTDALNIVVNEVEHGFRRQGGRRQVQGRGGMEIRATGRTATTNRRQTVTKKMKVSTTLTPTGTRLVEAKQVAYKMQAEEVVTTEFPGVDVGDMVRILVGTAKDDTVTVTTPPSTGVDIASYVCHPNPKTSKMMNTKISTWAQIHR